MKIYMQNFLYFKYDDILTYNHCGGSYHSYEMQVCEFRIVGFTLI